MKKWVEITHAVYPNMDRNTGSLLAKDKPYKSVYYECGGDKEKLLRESGFDEFPIMAPRWEVNGEDVYAHPALGCWRLVRLKRCNLSKNASHS
jgi:hypothetical protein